MRWGWARNAIPWWLVAHTLVWATPLCVVWRYIYSTSIYIFTQYLYIHSVSIYIESVSLASFQASLKEINDLEVHALLYNKKETDEYVVPRLCLPASLPPMILTPCPYDTNTIPLWPYQGEYRAFVHRRPCPLCYYHHAPMTLSGRVPRDGGALAPYATITMPL